MPRLRGKQIADHSITQANLGLADPVDLMDAATKNYVDSIATPTARLGGVLTVDAVNGNDSLGEVNGRSFLTIEAAISYITANSLQRVTIWVLPGTYNLTAGISIPATCSLRGLSLQTVILQKLNVVTATTLVTMGENTRLEDVQLRLTSSAEVDLVCVRFPGNTSVTAKIRTSVLTVDNKGVSTASTTNVYGLLSDGSGTADAATFSFNCIKGSTINVLSNGNGLKAGIYQPSGVSSANQLSTRDLNIYVAQPIDTASTGSYIGVVTDNEGSQSQFRTTSISGSPYQGVETNPAVRVLSLLNIVTLSGPQTIQGVSLVAGDRILLAGQSTGSQNGIYVVAAGAWTRAVDLPLGSNANGVWVPVTAGDYSGESWLCVSVPAVVGTDATVWKHSYYGADVKVPVRARYTGGSPTGARAAQGTYSPIDGDRLFLDSATSAIDNGLWTYNSGGAWVRSIDMSVGAQSLNSYVIVLDGTDAEKAYICTTSGTVGTSALTFVQKYLGSDVLQKAPQSANQTNGVNIGPGTDLITKTSGGRPFTTYVTPRTIDYALRGNVTSGTRYLWPGLQTITDATQVFYRFQQSSIVQGLFLNSRLTPGTDTITITIMKSQSGIPGSGVATAMSLSYTDGITEAENYETAVEFEQGTYLAVQIISTGNISNIDLILEIDTY